jgi:hypothetical protein
LGLIGVNRVPFSATSLGAEVPNEPAPVRSAGFLKPKHEHLEVRLDNERVRC